MDRRILIRIARDAIMEELTGLSLINRTELLSAYPWLGEMGAVFVTLNKRGALRGCIGSIAAQRDLIDDLVANAKAAALDDPKGALEDYNKAISLNPLPA